MKIIDWIRLLPLDYQAKIMSNIEMHNPCASCVYSTDAIDIQDALLKAFNWDNAIEGFEYWANLFVQLDDQRQ